MAYWPPALAVNRWSGEAQDGVGNSAGSVGKALFLVRPTLNRLSVFRDDSELSHWRGLPVHGGDYDRYCDRLRPVVSFDRSRHFSLAGEVGPEEVRTDEEEHDVCLLQVPEDLRFPVGARTDL